MFLHHVGMWKSKDTFVPENCKNSNAFENIKKIFLATKSIVVLKIEISSLQRPINICCTIFCRHFIEL